MLLRLFVSELIVMLIMGKLSAPASLLCQVEPTTSVAFTRLGVLGSDGLCRAFDDSGKGYVRSEGCAVVLVKRLSQAFEDHDHIYCLIRGTAVGRSV